MATPTMANQSRPAPEWATQYWGVVLDLHIHARCGRLFTQKLSPPRHSLKPSFADLDAAYRELDEGIARDRDDDGADQIPITNPARLSQLCFIVREVLVDVANWQDAAASCSDAARRKAAYEIWPLCRELWALLQHMPGDGPKPPMPSGKISAADLICHVDKVLAWCELQQLARQGTGKPSAPPTGKPAKERKRKRLDEAETSGSPSINLKYWAVGQYERGWKLFQRSKKVKTRDNLEEKWIDRGDIEIPKGTCHNLAAAFVKAGGALSSIEAKKEVGGSHPKHVKGRLCKAIKGAIARANSTGKPNVTIPLPIEYDRHGKSYQCVVDLGYAIRDDDGRHFFQSEEQRRKELEGELVRGA